LLACLSSLAVSAFAAPLPKAKHVVLVIEENRSNKDMLGNPDAPYINQLVGEGAFLNQSYAVMHPSEPNYVALFSGDTQGVVDDSCPHSYDKPNLGSALLAKGLSFVIYSENLPETGFTGCGSEDKLYRRKHNPVPDFPAVPAADNRPFSDFPADYSKLPVVSFLVPNMMDDMHDGTVAQADTWLKQKMDGYVQWALKNHSLLILTWDEDDGGDNNRVMTLIIGQDVKPGRYDRHVTHYGLLRTLTDMYRVKPIGHGAQAKAIGDIWK
jgi:acid phosphatase